MLINKQDLWNLRDCWNNERIYIYMQEKKRKGKILHIWLNNEYMNYASAKLFLLKNICTLLWQLCLLCTLWWGWWICLFENSIL